MLYYDTPPPVLSSFKSKDLPGLIKLLSVWASSWMLGFSLNRGFLTFILKSGPWTLQGALFS